MFREENSDFVQWIIEKKKKKKQFFSSCISFAQDLFQTN